MTAPREDWFQHYRNPATSKVNPAIRTVISKATKLFLTGILRVSLKNGRCEMLVTSIAMRAKQLQKGRNLLSRLQFSNFL